MKKYDLVVVGSGAGLMVLEEALNNGLRCAIVERGKIGGTCLTRGCIPSKMLVYPADVIRQMEALGRIGLHCERPQIDWDRISDRMWEQIDLNERIEESLRGIENLALYKGTGSFVGPDSLSVSYEDGRPDELLRGEKFVIAAGARTFVPAIDGLAEAGYLTSETFFGDKFPKKPWESLVLIGGGAIGAEFAHIFSALGTKVTVVEMSDRILNREEPEISDFVTRQFIKDGIDVRTGSAVVSVSTDGGRKCVTLEDTATKARTTVACEEIFVASGVRSNADSLHPDRAGVQVDARGWILTDSYLNTSAKGIWALGDINGKYQFRHKANYEAQILIENLFGQGEQKEVSYEAVPWATFTHPQVAHLGMTEQEVKDRGIPYRTAKNYYSDVVGGRAMGYRAQDEDDGFVKMIVGGDKKILGVHIVGPQAAVLLQPFVYLMNAGYECNHKLRQVANLHGIDELRILCPQMGTYAPINDSMVIHPALSELTAWVFEKLT